MQHGALPLAATLCVVALLVYSSEMRDALLAACSFIFHTVCLLGAIYLLLVYLADFWIRTNTVRTGWQLLSYCYAVGASFLLYLASPLLATPMSLFAPFVLELGKVNISLPAVDGDSFSEDLSTLANNVTSSSAWISLASDLHGEERQIGPLVILVCDESGCPGSLVAVTVLLLATLVYVIQVVYEGLVLGCGGGAAVWRHTREITDLAELEELRNYVARQCATQAANYSFSMALTAAWKLDNPSLAEQFESDQLKRDRAGKCSHVRRLFHGTTVKNAHSIMSDGFRLPLHRGMFGAGVYFADCPLKSLQYTDYHFSRRRAPGVAHGPGYGGYMLVCDVELGHALKTQSARPTFDPHKDLENGSLDSQVYDSVEAVPSKVGVRVPEFVVFNEAQALPRYIIAVQQVPRNDPLCVKERSILRVKSIASTTKPEPPPRFHQPFLTPPAPSPAALATSTTFSFFVHSPAASATPATPSSSAMRSTAALSASLGACDAHSTSNSALRGSSTLSPDRASSSFFEFPGVSAITQRKSNFFRSGSESGQKSDQRFDHGSAGCAPVSTSDLEAGRVSITVPSHTRFVAKRKRGLLWLRRVFEIDMHKGMLVRYYTPTSMATGFDARGTFRQALPLESVTASVADGDGGLTLTFDTKEEDQTPLTFKLWLMPHPDGMYHFSGHDSNGHPASHQPGSLAESRAELVKLINAAALEIRERRTMPFVYAPARLPVYDRHELEALPPIPPLSSLLSPSQSADTLSSHPPTLTTSATDAKQQPMTKGPAAATTGGPTPSETTPAKSWSSTPKSAVLTVLCCPIVAPFALLAILLVSVFRGLRRCWAAVCSCWNAFILLVFKKFKSAIFAIVDYVITPAGRAIHTVFVVPVIWVYTRTVKPASAAVWKCGKQVFLFVWRHASGLSRSVASGLVAADAHATRVLVLLLTTSGRAAKRVLQPVWSEGLLPALQSLVPALKSLAGLICKVLIVFCTEVVAPLCKLTTHLLKAFCAAYLVALAAVQYVVNVLIINPVSAVANWLYAYILSPLGRAISSFTLAVFTWMYAVVFSPLWWAISSFVAAIWSAVFPAGAAIFSVLSAVVHFVQTSVESAWRGAVSFFSKSSNTSMV